jgi:HEAT repeat protein
LRELPWRLFSGVRRRERPRFAFFAVLYGLLMGAQAVGLAAVESLLLSRLGVQALPAALLLASVVTFCGSGLFATATGGSPPDRTLRVTLLAAGGLATGSCLLAPAGPPWLFYALMCLFNLAWALLNALFWNLAGEVFDTLARKRLFPLLGVGASLGGMAGGLAAALAGRWLSSEALLAGWGLGLGAAFLWLRRGPTWPALRGGRARPLQDMLDGLRYLGRSPLGRGLTLSVLGLIPAMVVLQYIHSQLFVQSFPQADRLASFLGGLMAAGNLLELTLALGVTPGLIARLGVADANLVHPILTLLVLAGLAWDYGLALAVLAWIDRRTVQSALAGPVRALVYSALPERFRPRLRAFLEGFALYAALAVAAASLTLLGPRLTPGALCLGGALFTCLYLAASLLVCRSYVEELGQQLGRGELGLAGQGLGRWEKERLAALWRDLLSGGEAEAVPLLEGLAALLGRQGLEELLLSGCRHPHPAVRRSCVQAAGRRGAEVARDDPDPEVRLAALAHLEDPTPLLGDPDPRVRALAAARAGRLEILEAMARAPEAAARAAALERLSDPALALERLEDGSAPVRAAALGCLARSRAGPLARVAPAMGDPREEVRLAALEALAALSDPLAAPCLAGGLADASPRVRARAVTLLARRGPAGVRAAEPYLDSDHYRTVEAALKVLAESDTPEGRTLLQGELRRRVRQAWQDLLAAARCRPQDRLLQVAWENRLERNRRLALHLVALQEDAELMAGVLRALRFASAGSRAAALEILSNLGDRRTAQLLVLLLEEENKEERMAAARALLPPVPGLDELRAEARHSSDPWVAAAACGRAHRRLERLLWLRRCPLFNGLLLEELAAVEELTVEERFFPGQTIWPAGGVADRLYVVAEGSVEGLGPGQPLGAVSLLGGLPRPAATVSAEGCRLLSLDQGRLQQVVRENPQVALALFRQFSARLRQADEQARRLTGSS